MRILHFLVTTTLALSLVLPAIAQENNAVPIVEQGIEQSLENKLARFYLAKNDLSETCRALLLEHITLLSSPAEAQIVTPSLLRKLESDMSNILATEGYFSPQFRFEKNPQDDTQVAIQIIAGGRSVVKQIQFHWTGAFAQAFDAGQADALARRASLIKEWALPQNAPFRDEDWSRAKTLLLEKLRANVY
ncbi:MAG: hypothetical protein K2P84_13900, partial [Undibacterium sp.]|nr:hypothetical protein [Undibacterium sp.]